MSWPGIDAEKWSQLNRLLDEALDRPPAERAAWLDALAPQFESLKPRLRELLLRADALEAGGPLQTIPKLGDDSLVEAEPASPQPVQAGERVGRYVLTASWDGAAWARCGWPSAPTGSSNARSP
jgi:hypothetical protein